MKTRRKRIALCLENPLPLRGGVSVLVEILLLGLKDNYDLVLVSPDTQKSLADSPAAPYIATHVHWEPGHYTTSDPARQFAGQLAKTGVDLAHFHFGGNFGWGNRFPNLCPIPYVSRLGIPVVSTVHLVQDLLEGYCGPAKPAWFKLGFFPIAWAGKMRVLSHIHSEIAVSQKDAQRLRRWYWPMRRKFIHVYHSRLRGDTQTQVKLAREPVILNVGHIAWRKGQHVLAEAFASIAKRHPEWRLVIIGDTVEPACLQRIQEIAKHNQLENRILLIGRRDDALKFMQTSSIFVQPSFFEGLPLALQEAMFSGCACVATNIRGNNEIITHAENGLLVKVGDSAKLASALDRLVSSAETRELFSHKAPDPILKKGMTADKMLQKHLELYESILAS